MLFRALSLAWPSLSFIHIENHGPVNARNYHSATISKQRNEALVNET